MEADLAAVAALIADPSRAAMLDALTGGEPLTAGELAAPGRASRRRPRRATSRGSSAAGSS